MLIDSRFDKTFWREATVTVAYLMNLIPKKSLNNKTPEEGWNEIKPIPRANIRA